MACVNNESKEVKITSINTQGLKSNSEYITTLLDTNDIVFVCEHWLSNAEKVILKNLSDRHIPYFTPAEKGPSGRPFGGNCFLVLLGAFGGNCFLEIASWKLLLHV